MLSITFWCQPCHIPVVSRQGIGSTGAACPIQAGQRGGPNYSEVKEVGKGYFFAFFFPVPFFLREVENKAQQETYNPTNLLKMDTKPQAESELHSQCYFFSLRVLQSKVHSNNFVGIKRHKSLQN